ncbi:hypothetical protein PR202_gb08775 [Eleusine coracana subsp. coracana]|uniref:SAC domain-containing protein n=1 Tax=Eleusine coracana subsp. coracana TaxID=191504 RepID=A0AAV5EGF6_ELECO|nr:hypothetical protein PR202_gb08775 [Eleusine coracana subsp. coracana]
MRAPRDGYAPPAGREALLAAAVCKAGRAASSWNLLCRSAVVCAGYARRSPLGGTVFKVTGLKVLPCNNALSTSSAEQKKMEKEFSELLDAAERTIGLHFSYDINLTVSAQKLHDLGDEFKSLPLWRQAEQRFLWNSYLLEPLIENKLDQYLLPVIQGSFQNIHAEVGSEKVNVTLIARTRMWRRGADPEGYAANFVESEQIMQSKGFTASYVQVRGSMPFLWEQIVDLTYKPSFDVVKQEEAPRVLERHFHDLQKKYGAVMAVDLVNTGGGEGRLRERYAKSIEPILSEDLRYVHFDFHQICGHIHFERLSQLYEKIQNYLKAHRYFLINNKDEKIEEQTGIVRTNCIDCLDRTNVTQSMIGGKILESQLQRIGVLGVNDAISNHPAFDTNYKILWANHGDAISNQYSGTPALKGDFVRYGKRTTQGILNDLRNSLARYYLNNFVDGTKQSFRLAFALVMGALFFMMISLRQAKAETRNNVYFTTLRHHNLPPPHQPPLHCQQPVLVMVIEPGALSAVSRAEVDTSRPFQSVREAVEVFGERYNGGGNGSSSNASSEYSIKLGAVPPAASSVMLDCLKKLEVDLAEAKDELVQLKQRQSQMEMAVSSLSVQFSKDLAVYSGLNKGKELAIVDAQVTGAEDDDGKCRVRSDRWDESRAEEWVANLEYLPSLSEALSIKMIEDDLGQRKERKVKSKKASRKKHKKKRGISLVGGIFSKKTKSR